MAKSIQYRAVVDHVDVNNYFVYTSLTTSADNKINVDKPDDSQASFKPLDRTYVDIET